MTTPQIRITDPRSLPVTFGQKARAYVELTKPRIIELLLTTTLPAMVVAAGGWPGTWLVVATLVGGTLSSGGANAINQVIDRDIDRVMARTRRRPIPTGRVSERAAVGFGLVLGVAGFAWLWATVNLLAALLSTAALAFYVLVYSMALKRSTTQNIVIGGAAGSVPALVGWAAVTGSVALPAWVMFAVVFFWTPPHFWALAIRYRDDYAAAGVPMLPVVVGVERALDHILAYSVVLVGVSLLLPATGAVGWIYLTVAAGLGVWLVAGTWRLRRAPEEAMRFFGYSNVYLAVLFLAMALDPLLLG
ncbi:MAG: heme o synthase [Acidimicrobiia bacterium]|jgi:protoheme IX farnesyltransferase